MSKVARYLTIQELITDTQLIQQLGQDESTNRVDAIHTYLEVGLLDSLNIHQLQVEYRLNMTVVIAIINGNMTQLIYISIVKVFLFSNLQHLVTISSSQEFALTIQ